MSTAKPLNWTAIQTVLSAPRVSTYLAATSGDASRALDLYGWNARVSAALMLPAHFAEVATRNAVSDALTVLYGPNWPWDPTFEQSLPSAPRNLYSARQDLDRTRRRQPTTGKVIAELKFVFWQKMFTSRHDERVWTPHILGLFPNSTETVPSRLRARIYNDLEAIRLLRNRMAHHEPIFARDLALDLSKILDLVNLRCRYTADWVRTMERVSSILPERP